MAGRVDDEGGRVGAPHREGQDCGFGAHGTHRVKSLPRRQVLFNPACAAPALRLSISSAGRARRSRPPGRPAIPPATWTGAPARIRSTGSRKAPASSDFSGGPARGGSSPSIRCGEDSTSASRSTGPARAEWVPSVGSVRGPGTVVDSSCRARAGWGRSVRCHRGTALSGWSVSPSSGGMGPVSWFSERFSFSRFISFSNPDRNGSLHLVRGEIQLRDVNQLRRNRTRQPVAAEAQLLDLGQRTQFRGDRTRQTVMGQVQSRLLVAAERKAFEVSQLTQFRRYTTCEVILLEMKPLQACQLDPVPAGSDRSTHCPLRYSHLQVGQVAQLRWDRARQLVPRELQPSPAWPGCPTEVGSGPSTRSTRGPGSSGWPGCPTPTEWDRSIRCRASASPGWTVGQVRAGSVQSNFARRWPTTPVLSVCPTPARSSLQRWRFPGSDRLRQRGSRAPRSGSHWVMGMVVRQFMSSRGPWKA